MRILKSWIVPIIVSIALFWLVRPSFAQALAGKELLVQFLQDNNVQVGVESKNGYTQVYFVDNQGNKQFITEGNKNSRMPYSEGEYVAYVTNINGAGQIFRRNITTDTTIQITNSSTNLNPKVDKEGRVVWERWVSESWQIFLFDGILVKQVTNSGVSVNADIENNYLVFSQKDEEGVWRAIGHDIKDSKEIVIDTGSEIKNPKLDKGELFFDLSGTTRKSPLKVEELFLLESAFPLNVNPTDLSTPDSFTTQDIIDTINLQTDAEIDNLDGAQDEIVATTPTP